MRGNLTLSLSMFAAVRLRVYPRPCGETVRQVNGVNENQRGVYPRPCGETDSDADGGRFGRSHGSIPAHAGKPKTEEFEPRQALVEGLSPPMRGNLPHGRSAPAIGRLGSIPAHAGKPGFAISAPGAATCRVYPRPCGETVNVSSDDLSGAGGSIPAHAGKPAEPW